MTTNQLNAEVEFSPTAQSKKTQHTRILETIREQGFISKWGAIYDVRLKCSKLATRIGEIERKSGLQFTRERMFAVENGRRYFQGMRYSVPEGHTIDEFVA